MEQPNSQKTGQWLIIGGIAGFLISVVLSFTIFSNADHGALPAVSFLSIMIGMAFYFPTMLQEPSGGFSTMRVVVFAIVMLFCLIYLKIGWEQSSLAQFTIDKPWIYILGLAFGSKVFQRFGENKTQDEDKGDKSTETSEQEVIKKIPDNATQSLTQKTNSGQKRNANI